MSRHWATINEAGSIAGMRFMIWVDSVIGRGAFNFFLIFAMAYFLVFRAEARHASTTFLVRVRHMYPDALNDAPLMFLAYRHFYSFGQSLLDKYLASAKTSAGIAMDSADEKMLLGALAKETGCLLIGSHFGNLEYSRGIALRNPGLTINVLLYDQHARKFAALIEEGDPDSRMNLIQVTDIDIELAFTLREKVARGEWVVIAGDRVPVGDKSRVCGATFFGETANFPIGPYVLASLLQCPIYLLHCFRVNGEYRLGIEFFAEKIQSKRQNRQATYEKYAQKFASALEKQVVRAPLQWFNFFDFWGTPAAPEIRDSDHATS